MKAAFSSVFHKILSLFGRVRYLLGKVGSLFGRVRPFARKIGSSFNRVSPFFARVRPLSGKVGSSSRKVGPLFRTVRPLLHRVGDLLRKAGPLFRRVASLFRSVSSLLGRLIRRLWMLPPGRRIDRVLQRTWRRVKPPEYRFLPYVTTVLRVLGWVVLVTGVLSSILLGLEIMNGGLMVGSTELRGVGMGVSTIVLGIIGSFLAWLLLLVTRELLYLFIHVKENTRNAAIYLSDESN